ncbi:hypothetical protein [Micromonospora thermarum]|uniref:MYXO-CTERM domain-containing protein n=1 Tax=Micromonospora thermarum TaxID=2720024 RepID=A0ABX0ZAB6_9ACTN|nr:hypothetical protein [Micromonospora thermarum]NJP33036.1 hypothetical protein [Micromonospora thermarum]
MANKMLGKVVAGAALGGASLLVFTPGIAFADDSDHHRHDKDGKVIAKPHVVKPGDEVKLLQICEEPQKHAFVWSKVTGKVKLKPVDDRKHDKKDWKDEHDKKDWKDEHGKKDDHGKDREHDGKKDDHGKDREHDGKKDDHGKDDGYGYGGGAADDRERDHKDWKSDEHGQDGEYGRDSKDHEDKSRDYGYESDEYGKKDDGKKDDHGKDREHDGKKDDHGKDGWEHKKDFVYYGEAKVDKWAKPGEYKLKGSCGDGKLYVLPKGGVDGGDGGMTAGTDQGLAAGGASLLGAAALGGLVLLRRRRTDGALV